jgi:hypothetical protein
MLWETWRLTRAETAWKLAFGIGGGLAVLGLGATLAPADNAERYQRIMDDCAAVAMTLLVLPHLVSWLSLARLTGGRPGFPFHLHYSHPVRTPVMVGLPMAYLTAMSAAVYLVSALLLRVASGLAFPLLPVAAWIAALTVIFAAASWSTRDRIVQLTVTMVAITRTFGVTMDRLTSVELPGGYDWPPRLWPTLFDFPRTDYAWITLIGVASFGVTVAMVARQRRGDDLLPFSPAGVGSGALRTPRGGLWAWIVDLFRLPCPTSSPARAQVWLDLKFSGMPVLTSGMALALVILLVSAAAGPIDAAINANPRVSCPIAECFYVRAWPPLFAPLAFCAVMVLGGNAFGLRSTQGRTSFSAFEATQPFAAAPLAALKVLVKSACLLAAIAALGVSVLLSVALLGDAVFIQMWNLPLSSQLAATNGALARLAGYEQLALAVVAALGVVIWVAAFTALGALRTRYPRRTHVVAASLLLAGVALAMLALAARTGTVAPVVFDVLFAAARWTAIGALVCATAYVLWSGFAEGVLTIRYAAGAVVLSAAFAGAWLTALHAAGVQPAGMSAMNAALVLSPALLPLMAGALAPWSLSRIRHT